MNHLFKKLSLLALLSSPIFLFAQDTIVSNTSTYYGALIKLETNYVRFSSNNLTYQLKFDKLKTIKCSKKTLLNLGLSRSEFNAILKDIQNNRDTNNVILVQTKYEPLSTLDKNGLSKEEVIFNTYENQIFDSDSTQKYFKLGMADASKYYNTKYLGSLVFFESLFFPGVSIFTTAVASNTVPNEVRCVTDNYQKFNNKNYSVGYKNIALKKKRKTIWINFAAGTIINTVIIVTIIVLNRH